MAFGLNVDPVVRVGSEPDTPPAAGGGEKDKEKKKGPVVKLGDLKE